MRPPPDDIDPRLEPHQRLLASLDVPIPAMGGVIVSPDIFDPEIGTTTSNQPDGW